MSPNVDSLGLNRYPDPYVSTILLELYRIHCSDHCYRHQIELKQLFCNLRNTHTHTSKSLKPENLFLGVGSDEAIDALLRCFCTPGKDKILTCPPTYGMYGVSAQVNDLEVVNVSLDTADKFAIRPDAINQKLSADSSIKIVYVCSPGNPTASLVSKTALQQILEHPTWNGVVVLDEAYIDFAPDGSSLAEWVTEWPNLVVMQTLSKAFGLAGIRLGAAFTSPDIARLLNNLKAPYNISSPTSAVASAALAPENIKVMRTNRAKILQQRERLLVELPKIEGIGDFLGGQASNFLLVEILDEARDRGGKPSNAVALKVYEGLAENRGVVVRFRGKEEGCTGCLRVTVGTEKEVDKFLHEIQEIIGEIYSGRLELNGRRQEEDKETEANGVIA